MCSKRGKELCEGYSAELDKGLGEGLGGGDWVMLGTPILSLYSWDPSIGGYASDH